MHSLMSRAGEKNSGEFARLARAFGQMEQLASLTIHHDAMNGLSTTTALFIGTVV